MDCNESKGVKDSKRGNSGLEPNQTAAKPPLEEAPAATDLNFESKSFEFGINGDDSHNNAKPNTKDVTLHESRDNSKFHATDGDWVQVIRKVKGKVSQSPKSGVSIRMPATVKGPIARKLQNKPKFGQNTSHQELHPEASVSFNHKRRRPPSLQGSPIEAQNRRNGAQSSKAPSGMVVSAQESSSNSSLICEIFTQVLDEKGCST
ncbi:hypothetical protein PIB30_084419 [Stylosanthes scabra]|uniref:Uncharacterized protein n=1 Tax=Stylosanthes scabra TaxID=79078 RepID=A0ABU6TS11_9FABA|nr:hypothetical protein [Stylosanthes scabra]